MLRERGGLGKEDVIFMLTFQMPPHHRHQHDANHFDGAKYCMWARNVGVQTYAAIDPLLSSQIAEEQAYRSCHGEFMKTLHPPWRRFHRLPFGPSLPFGDARTVPMSPP